MARTPHAFGDQSVFDSDAKDHMPRSSWWATVKSGDEFSQAVQAQTARMTKSRFGRMAAKNLTTGGIDQRAALLSHRRATSPTIAGFDQ